MTFEVRQRIISFIACLFPTVLSSKIGLRSVKVFRSKKQLKGSWLFYKKRITGALMEAESSNFPLLKLFDFVKLVTRETIY